MSLRIRAIEIRIFTAAGRFGLKLSLPNGLVILRAENTRGKSTCLQAIIYALGLEGMLGPSREVPMPHVVTNSIDIGSESFQVQMSEVFLEIENSRNERRTIRRSIKGEESRDLVTVWEGSVTDPEWPLQSPQDYYVRQPGGATAPSGFHRFLATYIDWVLPDVPSFTGASVPLYPEVVFPLLYVEQKKGWGAIEGRFPTHLRIREPAARAVEFLLRLDARGIAAAKRNVQTSLESVKQQWIQTFRHADAAAKSVGGRLDGMPMQPLSVWPPSTPITLSIARDGDWFSVDSLIDELEAKLQSTLEDEIPTIAESDPAVRAELIESEQSLERNQLRLNLLLQGLEDDRAETTRLGRQIESIDEDLVRNKDVRKLQSLGSLATVPTALGECPTCHQPVGEILEFEIAASGDPMSIDENIAFLEDQRRVFSFMLGDTGRAIDQSERQLVSLRSQIAEEQSRIRVLKSALISDGRIPSVAAIEGRLRTEQSIRSLRSGKREALDRTNAFAELALEWAALKSELAKLAEDRASRSDDRKLAMLQESFTEQMLEYGVESLSPNEIAISKDSFKPTYGDFDLQFDLSASDTIRAAWAYRAGLLEVARLTESNHPGFLMLDEPRQQDASRESFAALLKRLSKTSESGQQVIVATSEPSESLEAMTSDIQAAVLDYDDRLFGPLP